MTPKRIKKMLIRNLEETQVRAFEQKSAANAQPFAAMSRLQSHLNN